LSENEIIFSTKQQQNNNKTTTKQQQNNNKTTTKQEQLHHRKTQSQLCPAMVKINSPLSCSTEKRVNQLN